MDRRKQYQESLDELAVIRKRWGGTGSQEEDEHLLGMDRIWLYMTDDQKKHFTKSPSTSPHR